MPQRQLHREVFFAYNGPGPYLCFGCEESIAFDDVFCVHHRNEDNQNNAADNLVAIHGGCHIRLHKTGFVHSVETRALIGQKAKGRVNSPEHKEALHLSHAGIPLSPETKEKIAAKHLGRPLSMVHRLAISNTLKSQITPEKRQQYSLWGQAGSAARWTKE